MTNDKQVTPFADEEPQDIVDQMRSNVLDEAEDAPTITKKRWAAKEIKGKRSPWLLRSLIVVLVLVIAAEGFLVVRNQRRWPDIIVQAAPSIDAPPAPTVAAPLPTPPIEGREEVAEPPILPTPTEAPLPEGLVDIEFPTPEE